MEVPKGRSREDIKTRKQIIKNFYAKWIAMHQDKKVWNKALRAYIYVKFISINETSGQASISYESTLEVLRMAEIMANATLVKRMLPKPGDMNQKPYLEILVMNYKTAKLVVGKQRTTGEYVQYCITSMVKK